MIYFDDLDLSAEGPDRRWLEDRGYHQTISCNDCGREPVFAVATQDWWLDVEGAGLWCRAVVDKTESTQRHDQTPKCCKPMPLVLLNRASGILTHRWDLLDVAQRGARLPEQDPLHDARVPPSCRGPHAGLT